MPQAFINFCWKYLPLFEPHYVCHGKGAVIHFGVSNHEYLLYSEHVMYDSPASPQLTDCSVARWSSDQVSADFRKTDHVMFAAV